MLGIPASTPYDLRFKVLGFPTRVHPLFWLITALLGGEVAGAAADQGRQLGGGRDREVGIHRMQGQPDLEAGVAGHRLDPQVAMVLLHHDAPGDVEAEPGALAHRLGGEEGLEDAVADRGVETKRARPAKSSSLVVSSSSSSTAEHVHAAVQSIDLLDLGLLLLLGAVSGGVRRGSDGRRSGASARSAEGEDEGLDSVALEQAGEQGGPVRRDLVVAAVQQGEDVVGGDLSSTVVEGKSGQAGDEFVLGANAEFSHFESD